MAKFSSVNNAPANGAVAMYLLKETMKSAGWTTQSSSDGTTYNSSGDQITSGNSGAGGFGNVQAWWRGRDPGGLREVTIQRGASNTVFRIKLSVLDRFTGGSPGATQTPSATDEAIMFGGGTDASPTFSTYFAGDGTYKWHCVAESSALGVSLGAGYGVWAWAATNGSGFLRTQFILEPLLAGSYPVADSRSAPTTGDADPMVYAVSYVAAADTNWLFVDNTNSNAWNSTTTTTTPCKAWFKYNMVGETYVNMVGNRYEDSANLTIHTFPRGAGTNPYDGTDEMVPMLVGRAVGRSTQLGAKGFTGYMRLKGNIARDFPSTVNLATDAMIYVGSFLVPWPNGVVPAL